MKHILKGDFIDGAFLLLLLVSSLLFFSFLQAKMLQKYEKKLDKINYIKYNFLISYRNVTTIKTCN